MYFLKKVCGARSTTGLHYGATTCYPCRAFFRCSVTVTDIVVGCGVGGGGGGLVYIFLLRICLVVLKDITQEIKRVIDHLSSMTTTL